MKRIIVSVTSDLSTDQRVHKVCMSLQEMGFEVLLIGRLLPDSFALNRPYKTLRMRLLFRKKFPFYAEYNLRLFFKLLVTPADILLANDLDTLLPNYLVSRVKKQKLVYDSHELFTEVAELTSRPHIRNVWLSIENRIFPKLKKVYTVNQSIADFYFKKYKVPVNVVRNISPKTDFEKPDPNFEKKIRIKEKMLILQGNGINRDRGAEEAIQMMQYLDDVVLYIIGGGDVFPELKKLTKQLKLADKVIFIDRLPYNELMRYTQVADLGLSLDKSTNLNYEYSLPNKVFDYIQARTPLFVTNRKEVARLVRENDIGFVTDTTDPEILSDQIRQILDDQNQLARWKNNLEHTAQKYTWEKEALKLKAIFKNILSRS